MDTLGELRGLIRRHAGSEALPNVALRTATAPRPPNSALFEPAFAVVAQGTKRAMLEENVFTYGAGQFLVVSVDLPIVAQIVRATPDAPYLAFAMGLKPAAIADLLLQAPADHRPAAEPASGPVGLAVSDAPPAMLDPITRLLRLLDEPESLPVLAPMLEREILFRLLQTEQGWRVRQIGLADSSLSQIGRAVRWIRAHFAERFPMEDVARVAGMSPATFYRRFRAVTAMSPLQYQKRLRLQEARARLMVDSRDVAAVGFAVGYDSPSQFSREYSRMFGAPPGKDVARLRGPVSSDRPSSSRRTGSAPTAAR